MSQFATSNPLAELYEAEGRKLRAEFLDACKFAKAVRTGTGRALLIGDQVITIDCSHEKVEWIAAALRVSAGVPA